MLHHLASEQYSEVRRAKTHCLRIQSHDTNRVSICPDRKRGISIDMACKKFCDYLVGLKFHLFTDHKSLVPLLSTKGLDELPLRVQRFRLRLMYYWSRMFQVKTWQCQMHCHGAYSMEAIKWQGWQGISRWGQCMSMWWLRTYQQQNVAFNKSGNTRRKMQSYDMFQSSVIVRYKNIPNEKAFLFCHQNCW